VSGFWRFDIATSTLTASEHFRALHGVAPEARFGLVQFLDALHPDDRHEHSRALDRAINESGRFDAVYRVYWPDGSVHRIHALGSVSPADGDRPPEIIGAAVELSD
jgi:PAS domain-containing protein